MISLTYFLSKYDVTQLKYEVTERLNFTFYLIYSLTFY